MSSIRVFLGLGANLDPTTSLRTGIQQLKRRFSGIQISPVYQAGAVGLDGPDFFNMVVAFNCDLALADLRIWIRQVEAKGGRNHDQPKPCNHGLDMDVLLYGDLVDVTGNNIPHDNILTCAYVLCPLADLIPDRQHPLKTLTMAQIWHEFAGAKNLQPVDFEFNCATI